MGTQFFQLLTPYTDPKPSNFPPQNLKILLISRFLDRVTILIMLLWESILIKVMIDHTVRSAVSATAGLLVVLLRELKRRICVRLG